MNTRDEKAGESVAESTFGFDQLRLTDDDNAVLVTVGSLERWDKSHLRRLRQSADLPGLVPVVDADAASDGKPYAVTPVIDAGSLADRLPPSASEWSDCAAITEAAARAAHEAHLRGLFHGSLSPDQIYVLDNDVAVAGVGLGLGGTPSADYRPWVAPEVRDGGDPTERSDVYSLGKILEASLGQSIDDVPRSVRRLIMWSSSDTPEARPPSALEFASILAEAMGEDRKTYSPAFIPTAEITDLASTASETVAAHVPSSPSRPGPGLGTVAAAGGAAAGAAALAGALSGDDDPDADDLLDAATETGEPAMSEATESAGSILEGADEGDADLDTVVDDNPIPDSPMADEAVTTADVAAGDQEVPGTDTAEVSEAELAAAVNGDDFDASQYSEQSLADADEGYDVPAAAQTIDLDEVPEDRRGNRAGILVGAILAAGLGLVAFQLLNSDDDSTSTDEVAGEVGADEDGDSDGGETGAAADDGDEEEETDSSDGGAGDDEEAGSGGGDDGADGDDGGSGSGGDAGDDGEGDGDGTETGNAAAGTDDETTTTTEESTTTTEESTTTTEESTTTTEESTTTTEESTTTTEESTTTTEESTTTTEESTTTTEEQAPAETATVTGPISADEAAIQVLHGIPGVDADVYLNGEALAPGFTPGTIAGPADLDPGTYDVAIYAATDSPPVSADERTDDPLITETVSVGAEPATLVAHLDAQGSPTLSAFPENLTTLAPGKSRIEVRHLAAAPPVELLVDGEPTGNLLQPGRSTSVVLDAGDHTIEAATEDGDPVKSATLAVADGELASISLIGSVDGGIEVAVQRYTGLGSAPEAVPTGDSNLLGDGEDPTGLYLLAALASLMAATGGFLMIRRSRQVL